MDQSRTSKKTTRRNNSKDHHRQVTSRKIQKKATPSVLPSAPITRSNPPSGRKNKPKKYRVNGEEVTPSGSDSDENVKKTSKQKNVDDKFNKSPSGSKKCRPTRGEQSRFGTGSGSGSVKTKVKQSLMNSTERKTRAEEYKTKKGEEPVVEKTNGTVVVDAPPPRKAKSPEYVKLFIDDSPEASGSTGRKKSGKVQNRKQSPAPAPAAVPSEDDFPLGLLTPLGVYLHGAPPLEDPTADLKQKGSPQALRERAHTPTKKKQKPSELGDD